MAEPAGEPVRLSHEAVEKIAVPSWSLFEEIVVAVGEAGAALMPRPPAPPVRRAPPGRGRPRSPVPEEPPEPLPVSRLLIYPPIGGEVPWGCNPYSPMGEGSEDTAVPLVDPAEVRLRLEQENRQ